MLLVLHAMAAAVWVGGMLFAHQCLRPVAANLLQPPLRLPLWQQTLKRFFVWVWLAVLLLPTTGYIMVLHYMHGFGAASLSVKIMHHSAWVMIAVFCYVYFLPYRALRKAVETQDWPKGGRELTRIRHAVAFNLLLGLTVVGVAASGRYW